MAKFFLEIDELIQNNETQKALNFLMSELEAQREMFGKEPNSEEVAEIYERMGLCYDIQRMAERAIESYAKAYRLNLKLKGSNSPKTAKMLESLTDCSNQSTKSKNKSHTKIESP
mmetsp:Transcript_6406/g.5774  ORF Transcript_6406/g.5774 Transcript_6406/m.5774 type:complete len:115 (+) Transcript_6406:94-438(+)